MKRVTIYREKGGPMKRVKGPGQTGPTARGIRKRVKRIRAATGMSKAEARPIARRRAAIYNARKSYSRKTKKGDT